MRYLVTPKYITQYPIHRWYWFPQSFSPPLIDAILNLFPISRGGCILDPFVGAGTTVLRAKELGYVGLGYDISPLAVFVSQTKIGTYCQNNLMECWESIRKAQPMPGELDGVLAKAFTPQEWAWFAGFTHVISQLPKPEADFFRLALLAVQKIISRGKPDGGWLRWVHKPDQSHHIPYLYNATINAFINDIRDAVPDQNATNQSAVYYGDARHIVGNPESVDMVITSPPYPNRHDYSRVTNVELLCLGLSDKDVKRFRHHSLRSHPEAKPPIDLPGTPRFYQPCLLHAIEHALEESKTERRIVNMISNYFKDLFMTLKALHAVMKKGAIACFVVGNVRYNGVVIPVDEILQVVGYQAGFSHEYTQVARERGNSPQQMKEYGRIASRESLVFLKKEV